MSFWERISDLINANIADALDKAEDPEKMANEYLRQLNDQYYEAKSQVAAAMADETRLQQKMIEAQSQVEQYRNMAETALTQGKEDLAKKALQHKLQAQNLAKQYEEQFRTQDEQVDELEDALAALEARISQTQAKRDLIIAKKNRTQTQQILQSTARSIGKISAIDKMDELEEKVDDQLAQADAMAKLESGSADAQFSELQTQSQVDSELAELKQKLGM